MVVLITILLSLAPWVYWAGMGYCNFYYWHLDENVAGFVVAPGLIPFFVADKLGAFPSGVFYLSALYPTIGFIIMFLT